MKGRVIAALAVGLTIVVGGLFWAFSMLPESSTSADTVKSSPSSSPSVVQTQATETPQPEPATTPSPSVSPGCTQMTQSDIDVWNTDGPGWFPENSAQITSKNVMCLLGPGLYEGDTWWVGVSEDPQGGVFGFFTTIPVDPTDFIQTIELDAGPEWWTWLQWSPERIKQAHVVFQWTIKQFEETYGQHTATS